MIVFLVLSVIFWVIFFIILSLLAWDNVMERERVLPSAFGLFIMTFAILGLVVAKSYKQGQVDALTGKVKYELVVNADSTKTWEEVK